MPNRNPATTPLSYFVMLFKPELLIIGVTPLGVALGVTLALVNGESVNFLPALSILPHNLCAAGVSPPETLGLLGNLGTGVLSTLPVRPSLADVRFFSAILSTIR